MALGSLRLMALGGWLVASLAAAVALLAWRSLWIRMDAVARACHELRGPITAARLGLQLGTRAGELSPVRLQAIDLELGRAALALDDLAGTRGAQACRPRVAELVDAHALMAASVEAWSGAAASRGVALHARWTGRPATVLGDRLRLAQATGNLIANAIEHGDRFVEVSGGGTGAVVRIEVIDGGPGLPAPVGELARRSRGRRHRTGRGHGLAIALAVAEAHGGRLAAGPAKAGARVVLELPVAAACGVAGGLGPPG